MRGEGVVSGSETYIMTHADRVARETISSILKPRRHYFIFSISSGHIHDELTTSIHRNESNYSDKSTFGGFARRALCTMPLNTMLGTFPSLQLLTTLLLLTMHPPSSHEMRTYHCIV